MSAVRMAISELRRITAGRLPVLAVLALLLIPMLYAGFYLYANGDPYSVWTRCLPRSSSRTRVAPTPTEGPERRPTSRRS